MEYFSFLSTVRTELTVTAAEQTAKQAATKAALYAILGDKERVWHGGAPKQPH